MLERRINKPFTDSFILFLILQQHMSSYPDLVAYRSIAVTLGQAGHMKELFDVIDSMQSPPKKKFKTGLLEKWDPRLEPDIIVYNSVCFNCPNSSLLQLFLCKIRFLKFGVLKHYDFFFLKEK